MRAELLAGCRPGSAVYTLASLLIVCAGLAVAEDRSSFSGSGREFIAIIQAEIAELEAQRDALELATRGVADRAAASQATLEGLTAQIAKAEERLAAAKSAAAEAEGRLGQFEQERARRQAEINTLQKDMQARQLMRYKLEVRVLELGRERAALEKSLMGIPSTEAAAVATPETPTLEERLNELRSTIARQQADQAALQQSLQALQHDRDALENQRAELEAMVVDLRKKAEAAKITQAKEAENVAASIAATARAQAQTAEVGGRLAALRDAVRSAIAERDARLRESADAEAQLTAAIRGLDELQARVEAGQREERDLEERLTAAREEAAQLGQIKAEIAAAERRLAEVQAEVTGGEARKSALIRDSAELQTANESARAARNEFEPAVALEAAAPAPAPGRRSAVAVRVAVGTAPGLTSASEAARAALITDLEGGACVTDALSSAFGTINRLTAAALVRGLGGC